MIIGETMIARSLHNEMSNDELMTGAHKQLEHVEAEMIRSVHLSPQERRVYVAAVAIGGSILGEGTTGIGKTKSAKTLAAITGGKFRRLQGTQDVTPDDVTGVAIWNPATQSFEFEEGPMFADVVLIDEINRMSPKAQSGALEAMGEGQVTAPRMATRTLPQQVVLGTQNPNEEEEGTSHLTKAQKDRFDVSLQLKSLTPADLLAIDKIAKYETKQRINIEDTPLMKQAAELVEVDQNLRLRTAQLTNEIVPSTKDKNNLPVVDRTQSQLDGYRAYRETIRWAQAFALSDSKEVVTDEHIFEAAQIALRHRVALEVGAMYNGITPEEVIAGAIDYLRNQ